MNFGFKQCNLLFSLRSTSRRVPNAFPRGFLLFDAQG